MKSTRPREAQPAGATQGARAGARADRGTGAPGAGNAAAQEGLRAAQGEGRPEGGWQLLGQSFGGLQEVHDWLVAEAARPGSTVPHEPVLRITATPGSRIPQRRQVTWSYYSPHQQLVIDGGGAEVDGGRGGRPTPGFFLAYRPVVGPSTEAAPARANFTMTGLTVRGFESGGVELSPQAGAGDDHRWDAGIAAFIDGAVIEGNRFEDLGSLHSAPGAADWATQRYGVGGVLARGTTGSRFSHNTFDDLENGDVRGTPTGQRLIHAVYLRDGSSGNEVVGNRFSDVSGDAIRVSNGSNGNEIAGNRARNSGVNALVSEFYNPTAGERDSQGQRLSGNRPGDTYGPSKKAAKPFHESVSRKKRPDLA
jgi:parallel beta-helix repeat protein